MQILKRTTGIPENSSSLPTTSFEKNDDFLKSVLSIDLEVSEKDNRIRAIGAVHGDNQRRFCGGGSHSEIEKLDQLADGADYLIGHNIIVFDLPHLAAASPNLKLLQLPVIDTLWLSPLAFPRNPYHHLVKHYQDASLIQGQINDPELDSRLALNLFHDEIEALKSAEPDLLTAWHWLCTSKPDGNIQAFDRLFTICRRSNRPSNSEATQAIWRQLKDSACSVHIQEALQAAGDHANWDFAYALAWISVAGGNSVMPPWVRHQFPGAGHLVRKLRDIACNTSTCKWCQDRHNACKELKRWFNFDAFRSHPKDNNGQSMQQSIVEVSMAGKHVLGVLPTGTGKSICYQIPALSRYDKTGALTVVISPLVALMADQVSGLEAKGIDSCVTVNGSLSMPERANALDRIRLGDAAIVLVSPEQLRARSFRQVLAQREIGNWVLDEAHCLSGWGHDFRPDYLYIGRFIRETAGKEIIPPVMCLTATAKPAVIEDIVKHFKDKVGIDLQVFNGGSERPNLNFEVIPTKTSSKFSDIFEVINKYLPADSPGGAIVYCATRKQTEDVTEYLQLKNLTVEYYHAGLKPEKKRDVQERFINGQISIICATNAFGMGIDKPDVRLVIHADIPGSLENYLQEAGRAGRDGKPAKCILLYTEEDVQRQFGLSARSRLSKREIQIILKSIRNLDRKKYSQGIVIATPGEILCEDEAGDFGRDSATDDTRIRTAVAWLEESTLLSRQENFVQIFPSSLRVNSIAEAMTKLKTPRITNFYREKLIRIVQLLIESNADEGVTTDELMGVTGLESIEVRKALYDLESLGIANNDTALTAYVHTGVERSSKNRMKEAVELEKALVNQMREAAPDQNIGESFPLHLRTAAQILRNEVSVDPLPERLARIVRSISQDGRGEQGATGNLSSRRFNSETIHIKLQRDWKAIDDIAAIRHEVAGILLDHLLSCLPESIHGIDLLAETTFGKLTNAIESDLILKNKISDVNKILDRALIWLHEQEIIRLNQGLVVFRQAMKICLPRNSQNKEGTDEDKKNRKQQYFTNDDFELLSQHYREQILQIHITQEFAKKGITAIREALRLVSDYFNLSKEDFIDRWLPHSATAINRQTTPESWREIVENLNNPIQKKIVADDRTQTNVLVLAGPGSGKTRVLVHRIAYLIRVKRENARGILALAYNRHAAVEIRQRLATLIGDDARGVTVLTCHALAMRLAGYSFSATADEKPDDNMFKEVLRRATNVLRGEDLPTNEADERRARLLAGFRWILVDEYQDIGHEEYELISALSGRTLEEEFRKLTLFAVGDDDQNIYAFSGASVEFIRRFESDYKSKPTYLVENYRSTKHIIAAANAIIETARNRLKTNHPITIDRKRMKEPDGGVWENLDTIGKGRVRILRAGNSPITQSQIVMNELERLEQCTKGSSENWDWAKCAVIARKWEYLTPVFAYCLLNKIPVQWGNEPIPSFWHLRETQMLLNRLQNLNTKFICASKLRKWFTEQPNNIWIDLLKQAIDEFELETGNSEQTVPYFTEWLAEYSHSVKRRQNGLLLITGHRSKGLEFDHVAILDGSWDSSRKNRNIDEERRLYYVAMTRARKTLTLMQLDNPNEFTSILRQHASVHCSGHIAMNKPVTELQYKIVRPDLKQVDIGFAGRSKPNDRRHQAIAGLKQGDSLQLLVTSNGRWLLQNQSGIAVSKLAKKFEPPPTMYCKSASVYATVQWSKRNSPSEYVESIKCERWEVVIPELVFAPVES